MIKFIALGGDGRTEFMAQSLTDKGFPTEISDSLSALENADAVILPLPYTADNIHIKGTEITVDDFASSIDKNKTVFIGKADEKIKNSLNARGIEFYDYNARDEFAQKNAVPTAQGVLSFVLSNTDVTLSSLKIAVFGYGKCGKAICKIFRNLGAEVMSFSRRYASAADAESDGMKAFLIKDAQNLADSADIIVNTVPVMILGRDFIDKMRPNSLLIDVSSYPYGFDIDYALSVNKKVNILPSLPGKCVPKSAGIIIAETIINIIEEGGLWKKSN